MRIVFIGSVKFSKSCLKKLIQIGAQPVGVCTLEKSSFNADWEDLSLICNQSNIPVRYVKNINSNADISWIESLKPDVIFCFGWSRLLKEKLLKVAPLGVVGFHPALLPKNRGRHPIIWALVLGFSETGSTFFFMDKGADSGDILSQKKLIIKQKDNAHSLYEKITLVALEQIEDFVPKLKSRSFNRTPQNHNDATTLRKRNEDDGKIDWRMSAESIHNLVRGLSKPYVGAHFDFNDSRVKVWETEIVKNKQLNIEPGKVIMHTKLGLIVKTGEDAILLRKIESPIDIKVGEYI